MRRLKELLDIFQLTLILLQTTKEAIRFRRAEELVRKKLQSVGVTLDGKRDSDIAILSVGFYESVDEEKVLLGLGESYALGLWTTKDLKGCLRMALSMGMIFGESIPQNIQKLSLRTRLTNLVFKAIGRRNKDEDAGEDKFGDICEIGVEFYQMILDPYMNLSTGYWKNTENLNTAQIQKMELIGLKLKLTAGMNVLVLNCGFGGICNYIAFNFQVRVVGVTNSRAQFTYAQKFYSSPCVSFKLMDFDYLLFTESFDCILLTEPFHIRDHTNFFRIIANSLKDDGLFLMESTGAPSNFRFVSIFDHLNLSTNYCSNISLKNVWEYFVVEEIENLGEHFFKTFQAWGEKIEKHATLIKNLLGENGFRQVRFHYTYNSEAFRLGKFQWWQVLLTKKDKAETRISGSLAIFNDL